MTGRYGRRARRGWLLRSHRQHRYARRPSNTRFEGRPLDPNRSAFEKPDEVHLAIRNERRADIHLVFSTPAAALIVWRFIER
jgi:hypothetical protein